MHPGLLVGAGFLLGTVGVKAIKSEPAKKMLVQAAVQGMRVKDEAETLIDQAKAEFDDVIAQASYEKNLGKGIDKAQAEASVDAANPATATSSADAVAVAAKPAIENATKTVTDATKSVNAGAGCGAGRGMGHGRGGK